MNNKINEFFRRVINAKYLFQEQEAEMWHLLCQRTTKFKTHWFKTTEILKKFPRNFITYKIFYLTSLQCFGLQNWSSSQSTTVCST